MNFWILLIVFILLPPGLFALANMFDYMVVAVRGKHDGDDGDEHEVSSFAYISMGCMIEIVLVLVPLTILCAVTGSFPDMKTFIPLFFNGISATVFMWLYLQAMKIEEDVTKIIPWYQAIPAFGLVLAWLRMEEKITGLGIFGIFLIIFGGLALWIGKEKINWKMIGLMILSSLFCAWNDVVLAQYGRELFDGMAYNSGNLKGNLMEALPAIFADLLGKGFFGIIFLANSKIRSEVKLAMKSKLGLTLASTLAYDLGDVIFDVAKLFAPVAIVQAFCCTQPLFVLVIVVLCGMLFKGYMKEELSRTSVTRKFFSISMMVAGGILLTKLLG